MLLDNVLLGRVLLYKVLMATAILTLVHYVLVSKALLLIVLKFTLILLRKNLFYLLKLVNEALDKVHPDHSLLQTSCSKKIEKMGDGKSEKDEKDKRVKGG